MAMTEEDRKRIREELDEMAEKDWSDFFSDVPSKRKRSEKELADLVREEYKRGIPLPDWYIEKYSVVPPETLTRWVSWWKEPRARYPLICLFIATLGLLELLIFRTGAGWPFLFISALLLVDDMHFFWKSWKTKRK